ncbi:glutaredoxin 3 [Thalassotalea sp. HSM 43]|uniref:glutaredoxin 3 n=1 Tax=Thalassotalea sp. HSM 43 TaxID=2552945 RepID=UPI001080FEA9|nr:glutaredoxin 3 [Thalassotalea sp. HSM 43]QBY04160.1 glutaredoxin 3 [Thalassotalea sp. HSM 43]
MAKVEIYTRQTCGFCVRAKMLLQQKQVEFSEISIDEFPEKRAEMIERSQGRMTVPQIFINDKPIGGCDDLFDLHYDGSLDALLNK